VAGGVQPGLAICHAHGGIEDLSHEAMPGEILQGFGKAKGRRPGYCTTCGLGTSFFLNGRRLIWPEIGGGEVLPPEPCVVEELWTCAHCDKPMVELHIHGGDDNGGVRAHEIRTVWPPRPPRDLATDVAEDVRSLYREASVAENAGASRAAAGMYRATVEQLCRAQGAQGRDLKTRINDLARFGVEQTLIEALHEARLLGNWTLHEGIEFTPEEVADVAELIEEAAHILYVEPAKRKTMRDARKARRDAGSNPT
jgi:hypothetical protein